MTVRDSNLTLLSVRRMMEGVVPPSLCTVSADGVPNVAYLSLAEYVDQEHIALSFQFFNRTHENLMATGRASLTLDDPYTGGGVVLQLRYQRTETDGPTFERLRAKLAGVASHTGMSNVFDLRGADIFKVLELRRVPGRRELPAALPRVDLAANARLLSERLARCEDLPALLDIMMCGLAELLLIDHAMLWILDASQLSMTLIASHGYDIGGIGAEISVGDGIAGTAAREGVPIRVGHMMNMTTYYRAVRSRVDDLGFVSIPKNEIPLPGLQEPRSQLAVPLRAQGHVLGVLFVESQHDQYFGYDDEDALMLLCGQFAIALALMQSYEAETPAASMPSPAGTLAGPPQRLRRSIVDNSIFLDGQYLIRGVAGAILWKLATEFVNSGRCEFTNRELRATPELGLPEIQDNLEVRLVLLQRRLAEHRAAIQIEKTGRGQFRLAVLRSIIMEELTSP